MVQRLTMMPAMTPNAPPQKSAGKPSDGVSRSRALAVASLVALIVLGLLWELVLAPTGRGTLALKVLPLAAALVGLLRYRMYTYRWLSLLVWLYVVEGAVRASSDVGLSARLAMLEIALCLVLFAACSVHVRQRLRSAPP